MLAPREVALRLVRRGLMRPETLLHGGVTLEDASHRNCDVTVRRRGRAILFVKQPTHADGAIEHEALLYRILGRDAGLARFLPPLRLAEPGFLVLGAVRGETFAARILRTRRVSQSTAGALGRAVALLHDAPLTVPGRPSPPWILSLVAPPIEILAIASAAHLEILRIVQRSREICRGLTALGSGSGAEVPVHNDLRFENCLLEPRRGRLDLKLVDWELAAMGDPAWDVGSALAAFAALWLFSFRWAPGMSMAAVAGTAAIPLGRIHPAANAFWRAYASTRNLGPRELAPFLARSVRFAAARLLQLSWERSRLATRPGAEVICTIQAAANIFSDTETAAALLFGTRVERTRA